MAININIDSQIVTQTVAQWAIDVTVYPANTILFASDLFYGLTDQQQFKKADGVQTFANLDYMPIGAGGDDHVIVNYSNNNGFPLSTATTYFLGVSNAIGGTVNTNPPVAVLTGTLVEAYIITHNGSTFGSSEGVTLTLVDELGTLLANISTAVKFDARNTFLVETLSVSLTAGRTFIKIVAPAMTTNPTFVRVAVALKIKL